MTSTLNTIAERWLTWIGPATWQIALLVAIVAVVATTLRWASPRLRYALWMLVLVKLFLPPTLAMEWGVGNWGVGPLWNLIAPNMESGFFEQSSPETILAEGSSSKAVDESMRTGEQGNVEVSRLSLLFMLWGLGCVVFLGVVGWQYRRLANAIEQMPVVEEGPLRVRLERIAMQLGLKRDVELRLSELATSPYLFGVLKPRVVLLQSMIEDLSETELDSVLLHELSHWQRRDTWIGWLQVVGQSLFWFHPLVWWANTRLRHERECACDEAVLRTGACEPADYGQALLGVLSAARGRSQVQGSLAGVFEPGGNIQNRLEEIMSYESGKREFGFLARTAVVALAVLLLPMAIPGLGANVADENGKPIEPRRFPWIVETTPAIGATDVDPGLKEITVTFDRDMGKGMSWTGGKDFFMPEVPDGKKPEWRDSRTCVLPVKLEEGQYYRVGINSSGYQNFKNTSGQSAACAAIYFTTKGASKAMQARVKVPQLVKMTPENGAETVDSKANRLLVVFDMPMGEGMSWTGGGEQFPETTGKAKWTQGGKACLLPVQLKPGKDYRLGINSWSYNNFQSKWGVPADSVVYEFKTAAK